MNNKNTYFISFEFYPFSQGGLARHATEIINRLIKTNKNYVAIVATPTSTNEDSNTNIKYIQCYFFKNKFLGYFEFSFKLLFTYIINNDSKFIFFSSFSYLFNIFLPKKFYLFITNTTKRVFITKYPEESKKDKYFRKITYFLLYLWEEYMAKKAQKIFAISASTKKDIIKQYRILDSHIKIVPCAINKVIFKPTDRIHKFNKQLLFVGRIVPRKNILDLIKIMKLLTSKDKSFILNIVGGGERKYEEKIKNEVIKFNLEDNIIFHGEVSDSKLNALYISSDIFIFTSLVEGFGLVILEAMSKGMPAIAYDVNGVKDIINNNINGYLVMPSDYEEFTNKILYLRDNTLPYLELSKNALNRINNFSWDNSVNELIQEIL